MQHGSGLEPDVTNRPAQASSQATNFPYRVPVSAE
jgi:hypothetical protein